jgi:hypothetical protein
VGGASPGKETTVRRFPPLFLLIYLGIGVAVAAERHYFQHIHHAKGVVAAILAILLCHQTYLGRSYNPPPWPANESSCRCWSATAAAPANRGACASRG